jgi:hypothetical protein
MFVIRRETLFTEHPYIRFNGDHIDLHLDPTLADKFPSKEDAQNFIDRHVTDSNFIAVVRLATAEKAWKKFVRAGYPAGQMNIVCPLSRKYNGESADEVLAWWIAYQKDIIANGEGRVRQADYSSWPDLYEKFECLHSVESYSNRGSDEPSKLTFSMHVDRATRFEDFKTELSKIVDHVDFLTEDGDKYIGVFDRHLSAGGNTVHFLVRKDGTYAIASRFDSIIVEGNLKRVFDYWKLHRYYQ